MMLEHQIWGWKVLQIYSKKGVLHDSMTPQMGLESGAILMEEDVGDDSMTPQMGLESGAIPIEEDIQEDSMTPHVGMEFRTHEDAYDFYNQYALKTGFGIKRSSTNTSRANRDAVIYRKFMCNKEGYRNDEAKGKGVAQVVHKRQLRVGCNARMFIKLTTSNTWIVSLFVKQHDNHELTTPSKTSKHRSHKKVHRKRTVKNLMTELRTEGLPNYEIAKVCNLFEASQDDRVTPQQVHDHLKIARKNNIGGKRYFVGRQQSDRSKWRTVTFDDSNGVTVSCDCNMFEFTGLLCRHALNILWKKHVLEIPNKYILKRWTMNARYQRVSNELHNSAPTTVENILYQRVKYKCSKALEEASKSPTFCEKFDIILSKMLSEDSSQNTAAQPFQCEASSQVNASQVGSTVAPTSQNYQQITVRDPTECVKTKGRPRAPSRIQSGLELSQEETIKKQKQRTCGFCGEKGHYITGCAKKKAFDAATTSTHLSL